MQSCVLRILQIGSGFHQRMAGWRDNGILTFLSGEPNGGGGCLREKGGGCAQRSPFLWAVLTYKSVASHRILHSEYTVEFCFPRSVTHRPQVNRPMENSRGSLSFYDKASDGAPLTVLGSSILSWCSKYQAGPAQGLSESPVILEVECTSHTGFSVWSLAPGRGARRALSVRHS